MSTAREGTWKLVRRIHRRTRRLRARARGFQPAIAMGARSEVGRGCRFLLEPGARLIVGEGVEIDDFTTLAVYRGGVLELGSGCFVGHHSTLAARNLVVIGPRTFLAEMVSIRDHDHDPDQPPSSGASRVAEVHVGTDVWLAAKVTVSLGVKIGDRTVVGANAVVTRPLPSDVVAGGIPARVLREKLTDPRPG